MQVSEAGIFGLEAHGFLLVEQVQAMAGEGDVVRGEREEQALRWSGGTGRRLWLRF